MCLEPSRATKTPVLAYALKHGSEEGTTFSTLNKYTSVSFTATAFFFIDQRIAATHSHSDHSPYSPRQPAKQRTSRKANDRDDDSDSEYEEELAQPGPGNQGNGQNIMGQAQPAGVANAGGAGIVPEGGQVERGQVEGGAVAGAGATLAVAGAGMAPDSDIRAQMKAHMKASSAAGGGATSSAGKKVQPVIPTIHLAVILTLFKVAAKSVGVKLSGNGAWCPRRHIWQYESDHVPSTFKANGATHPTPAFFTSEYDHILTKCGPMTFAIGTPSKYSLCPCFTAAELTSIDVFALRDDNGWCLVFTPANSAIDVVS